MPPLPRLSNLAMCSYSLLGLDSWGLGAGHYTKGFMTMARKAPKTPWHLTASAHASYLEARAVAQARANETGHDIGLEANDLFRTWNSFMLPAPQYRSGHELRCEVVSPERLEACKAGHGPVA